jgi:signal transduction histidine kinase
MPTWNRKTIARDVILNNLLAIGAVSLMLGVVSIRLASRPLDTDLRQRADGTAQRLARTVTEAVWNLDTASIRRTLPASILADDLVEVVVRTQFGDELVRTRVSGEPDVVRVSRHITHKGERIGSVDVCFSRQGVRRMQRTIALSLALSIGAAVLIMVAATTQVLELRLTRPLQKLTDGIRRIAAGDYRQRLPPARHVDIHAIHEEVNAMAGQIAERTEALRASQANLEALVRERTAQLTQTNGRLLHETQQRRQAQQRSIEIGDLEQQRIGRDLHDTLGQHLTGTGFLVASLASKLHGRRLPEAMEADRVAELVRAGIAQTRHLARGLAPMDINDRGLAAALAQLARNTEDLHRIACRVQSAGSRFDALDPAAATHLYRIALEAVGNAVRHGRPSAIDILLELEPGCGRLLIRDNGRGFAPGRDPADGMGLWTMRSRAEMLGGECTVESVPGAGTTVRIAFPLHGAADPADRALSDLTAPGGAARPGQTATWGINSRS